MSPDGSSSPSPTTRSSQLLQLLFVEQGFMQWLCLSGESVARLSFRDVTPTPLWVAGFYLPGYMHCVKFLWVPFVEGLGATAPRKRQWWVAGAAAVLAVCNALLAFNDGRLGDPHVVLLSALLVMTLMCATKDTITAAWAADECHGQSGRMEQRGYVFGFSACKLAFLGVSWFGSQWLFMALSVYYVGIAAVLCCHNDGAKAVETKVSIVTVGREVRQTLGQARFRWVLAALLMQGLPFGTWALFRTKVIATLGPDYFPQLNVALTFVDLMLQPALDRLSRLVGGREKSAFARWRSCARWDFYLLCAVIPVTIWMQDIPAVRYFAIPLIHTISNVSGNIGGRHLSDFIAEVATATPRSKGTTIALLRSADRAGCTWPAQVAVLTYGALLQRLSTTHAEAATAVAVTIGGVTAWRLVVNRATWRQVDADKCGNAKYS
jgi:hypothetical protein